MSTVNEARVRVSVTLSQLNRKYKYMNAVPDIKVLFSKKYM